MSDFVKIAVDAMGGDNSPKKIIEGIIHNHKKNKNIFFKIFGEKDKIETIIDKKINKNSLINKKELNDELVKSYVIDKGPLYGLVGTADLRLQTITLIGQKNLMKTAEKYIKNLDVRHRQVALTIKIIDVSLSKTDIKNNVFELRNGNTRIINNGGFALIFIILFTNNV